MRIPCFCTLLILSALGTSFGQDTNFAQGPQYLMNQGSPLLARPCLHAISVTKQRAA